MPAARTKKRPPRLTPGPGEHEPRRVSDLNSPAWSMTPPKAIPRRPVTSEGAAYVDPVDPSTKSARAPAWKFGSEPAARPRSAAAVDKRSYNPSDPSKVRAPGWKFGGTTVSPIPRRQSPPSPGPGYVDLPVPGKARAPAWQFSKSTTSNQRAGSNPGTAPTPSLAWPRLELAARDPRSSHPPTQAIGPTRAVRRPGRASTAAPSEPTRRALRRGR